MKTAFIVCAVLLAMASATPVSIVEQPGEHPVQVQVAHPQPSEQVQVAYPGQQIIYNPDPGFYQPSNNPPGGVLYNVDPGFYQPGSNYAPGGNYPPGGIIVNPDPGFYRPTAPPGGLYPDTGFVQVVPGGNTQPGNILNPVDPGFSVGGDSGYRYPGKQYNNPWARDGGK